MYYIRLKKYMLAWIYMYLTRLDQTGYDPIRPHQRHYYFPPPWFQRLSQSSHLSSFTLNLPTFSYHPSGPGGSATDELLPLQKLVTDETLPSKQVVPWTATPRHVLHRLLERTLVPPIWGRIGIMTNFSFSSPKTWFFRQCPPVKSVMLTGPTGHRLCSQKAPSERCLAPVNWCITEHLQK
jgi:hypothetical protein